MFVFLKPRTIRSGRENAKPDTQGFTPCKISVRLIRWRLQVGARSAASGWVRPLTTHSVLKKKIHMKLRSKSKLVIAAALGLACSTGIARAQLLINLREQATFTSFVGGSPNTVTNNGSFNTTETLSTGTSATPATPFWLTYTPITGPSTVTLGTGTLVTSSLSFNSPVNPVNYFTSVLETLNYDFDNNGSIDLTQNYTVGLSSMVSPAGLTGVNYSIIPATSFGSVVINGTNYNYASLVANSSGSLFDGSSTTSVIQFQFIAVPLTAVPEPSTYALAGALVLGGVVLLRRRRSIAASVVNA